MARLAISSAMSLGGSLIGVGASYGWLAGSALGNLLLGPRTEVHEGSRLKDFSVPHHTYGSFIPVIYGAFKVFCPLIWSSDIKESKTTSLQRGKFSNTQRNFYTYSSSFAVALGEGVIDRVLRIWADDQLIYDATNGCISKYDTIMRFYKGTEDQSSDPTIESYEGVEMTPAFRGLAYIVFEDFPLGDFGNRIPHFSCEVSTKTKRTYSHESLKIKPLQHDNTILSSKTQYLYHAHGGVISKVDRLSVSLVLQKNVLGDFQQNARLVGRLSIDPETEEIYSAVEQGHSTCIAVFDHESLILKRHNQQNPSSWSHETELYVTENHVWSADAFSGQIRCYSKSSLDLKFAVSLDRSRCAQIGNFTEDDQGNIWMISGGKENDHGSLLTKLTPSGQATFFELNGFGLFNGITYDSITKSLFLGGSSRLLNINSKTGAILRQADIQVSQSYAQSSWASQARTRGKVWLKCGTKAVLFNTRTFSKEESIDVAEKWGVDLKGMTYDPLRGGIWTTDGQLHLITFENYISAPIQLEYIVEDLCKRTGLSTEDFSIQFKEKKDVYGFALGRFLTARQHLSSLSSLFFFEARLTGHHLNFISPYEEGWPTTKITEGDLCVGGERAKFSKTVDPVSTASRKVSLTYLNRHNFYEPSIQHAIIHQYSESKVCSEGYSVSIVLDDAQAQSIAENILKVIDASRYTYTFVLPPPYAFLRKGDLLELSFGKIKDRVVVTSFAHGANNQVEIEGTRLRILDTNKSTGVPSRIVSHKIEPQGLTQLVVIDSLPLFEGDSVNTLYFAAAGTIPHWRGAEVYLKLKNNDYHFLTFVSPNNESVMGMLTASLSSYSSNDWDEENKVYICVPSGSELTNCSREEVLEGMNLLLVGREILQYSSAQQLDETHWVLSGLLRARRGTKQPITSHEISTRVVVLDESTVLRIPASKALNKALGVRAITLGKQFESGLDVSIPKTNIRSRLLAPTCLKIERDSTGLCVHWAHQSRLTFDESLDLLNEVDPDLRGYEIEIMPDDGVQKTFSLAVVASFKLSDEDQKNHFGKLLATGKIKVSALNHRSERGRVAELNFSLLNQ